MRRAQVRRRWALYGRAPAGAAHGGGGGGGSSPRPGGAAPARGRCRGLAASPAGGRLPPGPACPPPEPRGRQKAPGEPDASGLRCCRIPKGDGPGRSLALKRLIFESFSTGCHRLERECFNFSSDEIA